MKKTGLITLGLMIAKLGFSLSLEVAPLQLRGGVEVMGIQASVDGSRAIVFAGQTASRLARAAGMTLNVGTQAIVATGSEVNHLVGASLRGVGAAGKTALITSANLASAATNLAFDAIDSGLNIVSVPLSGVSLATRSALVGLQMASQTALVLVQDTGVQVFNSGRKVVGNIFALPFNILGFFGL